MDVNSVTDAVIQDNVFFNDFAGSGRPNLNNTSSFIVIKDSNAGDDGQIGSERITVRRNVFLNWQGSSGANFVLTGEDGQPFYEAVDVLVENILMTTHHLLQQHLVGSDGHDGHRLRGRQRLLRRPPLGDERGGDYNSASGGLTFTPGQVSKAVDVTVLGDTAVEGDEGFFVNLTGAVNATVGDGQGVGTILDDDAPSLSSHELRHGAMEVADLAADPGPATDEDLYSLAQDPRASYEVVVDATSGDVDPVVVERLASDNTTVLQASVAMGTGSSRSLRWENVIPGKVTRQHIRVRSGGCTTNCGTDDVYRIRVYETTYSVPRFNNSGSQVTVVLLQNPTAYTISGHAYFWDGAGVLLYGHSFSLTPKALLGLSLAGIPALQGKGGTITVSNNGRYGDLAGKAIALEPATGFSFDSPMTPRPR